MTRLRDPLGPHDHVLGRPRAPAELVEYGDYECAFCARAHLEMVEVLRRVGGDLRYAFRHFPLVDLHPHAMLAAQAAEAAAEQGRFWPMHSMLFENQHALATEDLMVYAGSLGLDTHRFARDLRAPGRLPKVQNDLRTGARSGVRGTPTFFLDALRVEEGWDADTLTTAIRELTRRRPPPPRQGAPGR